MDPQTIETEPDGSTCGAGDAIEREVGSLQRIVVAAKAGTDQPWLAQAAADLAAQSGAVVDVVSAVNIGVIILRRTRPDLERGYRVPFVPVVPIIGTLLCIYLMVDLPGATWARFVIWMAIGLVIYFLYGRRNSRLRRGEVTNPEAELPGSP
jgi:uncharacterized membrane protein YfcA